MILAQDVRARNEALFVARGQEVTRGMQEKFRNFAGGFLGGDVIRVIVPDRPATPASGEPTQP
jgi:hypothetical protein